MKAPNKIEIPIEVLVGEKNVDEIVKEIKQLKQENNKFKKLMKKYHIKNIDELDQNIEYARKKANEDFAYSVTLSQLKNQIDCLLDKANIKDNTKEVFELACEKVYLDYQQSLTECGYIAMPSKDWYIMLAKDEIKAKGE